MTLPSHICSRSAPHQLLRWFYHWGVNQGTVSNKPTDSKSKAQLVRKCKSVASSSPGPHSCTLSLPNYLNARPLSSPGTPLDSCLLGLWGRAACKHRPTADMHSIWAQRETSQWGVDTAWGGRETWPGDWEERRGRKIFGKWDERKRKKTWEECVIFPLCLLSKNPKGSSRRSPAASHCC